MGSKKANGSRKDPRKTPKVWQRARREKMKIYFDELQEVLPFYDPSAPMSRFEILQKSKMYIKDLQDQNQELLNSGFDEIYQVKMTKLKERVKELLKRVDQLTDLLRTANIMIPPLEAYPEGVKTSNTFKWMSQRPKKWTEKINIVVPDEKIKSVLTLIKDYKKNSSKINVKKKQSPDKPAKPDRVVISESCLHKTVTRKKKIFKKISKCKNIKSVKGDSNYEKSDTINGSQSPSQFKENQPVDFNLLSNNSSVVSKGNNCCVQSSSETVEANKNNENTSDQVTLSAVPINKITVPIEAQHNVILQSAPNFLQSNTFILTNNGSLVQLPILNSSGTVYAANSNLLTSPEITKSNTGLVTPLVINKPSPVIVLQKPPQSIIQTAPIINSNHKVISVSKAGVQIFGGSILYTSSSAISTARTLSHILAKAPSNKKRIARDSTTTTYVNKIPIPALSKQSYAKKSAIAVNSKEKSTNAKGKDTSDKALENANQNIEVNPNDEQNMKETNQPQFKEINSEIAVRENEKVSENKIRAEGPKKREILLDKAENHKKQKLDEMSLVTSEENVFKPIENEADGMFCNLSLPNSINPSLSVSPTAAFLSSFPIVAPIRSEAEDEISERKTDDGKDPKQNINTQSTELEKSDLVNNSTKVVAKQCITRESAKNTMEIQVNLQKEKMTETSKEQMRFPSDSNSVSITSNSKIDLAQQQLESCKTWDQFHHENCEIRPEAFYLPTDNNIQIHNSVTAVETGNVSSISFPSIANNINNSSYNVYSQNSSVKSNHLGIQNTLNEQVTIKTNQFEYSQKENYMNKLSVYNGDRTVLKKPCTNSVADSYNIPKSQSTSFEMDSAPNYRLIPAKEVPNQRNGRTVNWMTEPDIRNRGMVYGSQNDKMTSGKQPIYSQSENFYMTDQNSKISNECSGHFVTNDQNKVNYQKNDFFVKDHRCKTVEKRPESKCYAKTTQNSYNIFDYNYAGSCYAEDDSAKYCNSQTFPVKSKKNINQHKKKSDDIHNVNNEQQSNDQTKRPSDQIIGNIDFNPVANQECFTWIPGKNVEWLPSKSFGLDTNLVVPSTLPTLVGDLALGTTSANDVNQAKGINSKICQSNLKSNSNDVSKDYVEIGMGSNSTLTKTIENIDTSKQYLEPFANLSKNIFDVTPSNVHNTQMPKNDFEKINFPGINNNETIVLKNIFELPVSKSFGGDFSRNKQRTVNTSQNTFLSVSQLVEPPTFEGDSLKNENQIETAATKDLYAQPYPNYINQKSYKNKARSSHCKFNDRKYHSYKNGSSSYTAEALIRSNININYQPNEFVPDVNTNFFNGKNNQKPEQFTSNNKIDFEINMKSDFVTGPSQNIYSDFNFSSPVPNFTIGSTVSTDFGNHDSSANFTAQNNTFFSDFITPEFPLSDNVPNSLLLPPCSIALQNPFVIDKRNVPTEKNKTNSKQYSASRNRKHYECTKTTFNDFSIPSTSVVFTTSSLHCSTVFTTSACQNLLPVPTQSIPITFSSPSFTTSNISFPPLSTNTNSSYHRFPNSSQNSSTGSFLPSSTMFTTCTSKPLSSSHGCYSSNPLTNVTNSVISSPFQVGNVPFSGSSQSSIPFFSLSNPIVPSSAPTSSSNSLANFNLSTIFPEINQKGNYHYS